MSQIVLITGASSGIGKETAHLLLKNGFTVYATARRVEQMEDLKKAGAIILKMDVTKTAEIKAVVTQIKLDTSTHSQKPHGSVTEGRIDILINNAGFGMYAAMEDTPMDEAKYLFEVNLFGLANLTNEVLPIMRAQGSGKIINTSSIAGKMHTPFAAWYHASKHALEGWSDCLRMEVKQFGIDVILIEPGLIKTEFANELMDKMMIRSGTGAYKNMATTVKKVSDKIYYQSNPSPPSVIARLILKAVKTKKPKTRYVGGKFAKMSLFFRWILSDKMFVKGLKARLK